MGILMFVNGAAQVVASLVGGYTAELFGWRATFWLGMFLGLAALPVLALAPERRQSSAHPPTVKDIWQVATVPLLIVISALGALGQFAAWANVSFVPVYGDRIGATKGDLGLMLMLVFGSASLASLAGIYLGERLGLARVQVLGFVVMAVSCAAIPFTHSVLMLGVTQVVGGVGRGLFFPAQMTMSVQRVAPERRAIAMGVFQAVYAVGMLLGPLLSGITAQALGIASMFYVAAAVSLFCAVVSALPWLARASSRPGAASTRG
jgi:predicted MFS family arabinose efflux permease